MDEPQLPIKQAWPSLFALFIGAALLVAAALIGAIAAYAATSSDGAIRVTVYQNNPITHSRKPLTNATVSIGVTDGSHHCLEKNESSNGNGVANFTRCKSGSLKYYVISATHSGFNQDPNSPFKFKRSHFTVRQGRTTLISVWLRSTSGTKPPSGGNPGSGSGTTSNGTSGSGGSGSGGQTIGAPRGSDLDTSGTCPNGCTVTAGQPAPLISPPRNVAQQNEANQVAANNPDLVSIEEQLLANTNNDRAANGLGPLTLDPDLTTSARGHSFEMAQECFFSHESYTSHSDGNESDDIDARQVAAGVPIMDNDDVGENAGWFSQYTESTLAGVAETSFSNSPEHWANIISPLYNYIGIGIIAQPLVAQDPNACGGQSNPNSTANVGNSYYSPQNTQDPDIYFITVDFNSIQ